MGLFPPFCILFHFVPHPLDQRLDRRLIPLQFVRDLRDGFSLPELGSDEAFYLILTSFVIPFPDAFCDSPVYCRPDRHSLCMEPHPFHKEHILF